MDFKKLKEKVLKIKDKALEFTNKTNNEIVKKLKESKIVLKTNEELKNFIETSQNKKYINSEWIEKIFIKKSIIFFINFSNTKLIFLFIPILMTKWFSQNIKVAFVDVDNKDLDYSFLNLKETPCIVLFENKENTKTIYWEENIKKVAKSLDLDIIKIIDEL